MQSEIRETSEVFSRILENRASFNEIGCMLQSKQFQSVIILARGTSDNAAYFLKYLMTFLHISLRFKPFNTKYIV